ncbi:hypothetical protein DFS34DRAFT_648660 [Phlyctochytrium arcticum]|nr:hypothetical protein DFS34DRAFT_648660 [Phlyctochytrium arcticum]
MDGGEDPLDEHKLRILNETKNVSSFVVIGETLHKLYYEDKLMKTQKEFLEWTKANLGFSKSTTYEYIISYRIYSDIQEKLPKEYRPPMYQSHCQLLSKVPQKKLVDVWVDVCQQAPNGVITTAFLEMYLDKNNLKVPKSRNSDKASKEGSPAPFNSFSQGSTSSATSRAGYETPVPNRRRRSGLSNASSSSGRVSKVKQARHQEDSAQASQRRRIEAAVQLQQLEAAAAAHFSSMVPPPPHQAPANIPAPMTVPPPLSHAMSLCSTTTDCGRDDPQSSFMDDEERPKLPFNDGFIFELSKNVVIGQQFDMVLQTVRDFKVAEQQAWFGRLWCNLSGIRPFSTAQIYGLGGHSSFEGGVERLLQIIFTKFANKEFVEGLFLLKAEFGADWFTPILQHPYCILRHNNPPMSPPLQANPSMSNDPSDERSEVNYMSLDQKPQQNDGENQLPQNETNPPPSDSPAPTPAPRSPSSLPLNHHASHPPAAANSHQAYESFVMFYLGTNIKEFCNVFRSVGLVPGFNSWSALMNASMLGMFIPPAAQAHEAPDASAADLHSSLNEAASALVDIAGFHGMSAAPANGSTRPHHQQPDASLHHQPQQQQFPLSASATSQAFSPEPTVSSETHQSAPK